MTINPTALLALARKLALPAAFKATQGEIQSLAADYVAQATRIEALEAGLVEACDMGEPLAETIESTWTGAHHFKAKEFRERFAALRALVKP